MPSPLHLPSSACLALHTHLALLRPSHPGPSARCWLDPTASPPSWAQPPSPAARGGTKWRPLGPAALLHREQPAARGQHQQSTWNVLRHKSVSTSGAAHLPHTWNNNTQPKKNTCSFSWFCGCRLLRSLWLSVSFPWQETQRETRKNNSTVHFYQGLKTVMLFGKSIVEKHADLNANYRKHIYRQQ